MFPSFVVSTNDLQPDQKYTMTFRCNSADSKRYKFVNSKWEVAGKADSHISDLLSYIHPDSPAHGKHWLHNKIQFKKVKLTNNKSRKGQVLLLYLVKILSINYLFSFIDCFKFNAQIYSNCYCQQIYFKKEDRYYTRTTISRSSLLCCNSISK